VLLLLAATAVAAEEGGTVEAGAGLSTNLRLSPSGYWLDFRDTAVFSPWASARPGPRVRARGSVDFRLHNASVFDSIEGASSVDGTQPWSLRVRDAWISTRAEHLSVKVGAQRVAWGVGTGISLVDNLNPWDLEDPTRFDRRLSVPAVHAVSSFGAWSVEGAWMPFFVAGALPSSGVSLTAGSEDVFDTESTGAEGVEIRDLETRVSLPQGAIWNGGFGGRARWSSPWADLALSWFHGRDSLPQVHGDVLLTGFQTDTDRVDVGVPLIYPIVDVGGLEVKGELFSGTSGWAEVAVVLPTYTAASISLAQLESLEKLGTIDEIPDPLPVTVTQDGEPYLKWLVGLDRFFGPVYLNVQWLHGFPTERQQADLRDYALLAARWGITPITRLDLTGASDAAGWLGGVGLTRLVADTVELSAGGVLIGGAEGSALAGFSGVSHARLSATMQF
jgi:hypothetical protein